MTWVGAAAGMMRGVRARGRRGLVKQQKEAMWIHRRHLPKGILGLAGGLLRQGCGQPPQFAPAAGNGKAAGKGTKASPLRGK